MVEYRIRLRPGATKPHPLWDRIPDELAVRVGRFVAACSLIEFEIEVIIWHLTGATSKHDRLDLTSRLDARRKAAAIKKLLKNHTVPLEQLAAWEAAEPLLEELAERRNWVVHGVWWPVPIMETSVLRTRKGKPPDSIARLRRIDVTDLDDWIGTAAEAVEHLSKLKLLPAGTMAP
jgi:hypothetical protein